MKGTNLIFRKKGKGKGKVLCTSHKGPSGA